MSNEKKTKKPSRLSKNTLTTAKRLLKYVTETYKFRFVLVFVCILISSVASISVSLSLKYMLDDFIIPFYKILSGAGCFRLYLFNGCAFYVYLYTNDGIHWSGCVKACA